MIFSILDEKYISTYNNEIYFDESNIQSELLKIGIIIDKLIIKDILKNLNNIFESVGNKYVYYIHNFKI